MIGRNFTLRHLKLMNIITMISINPNEHEHQTHLRHLNDGGNLAATSLDFYERRLSRQIVIPNVVMYELLVPDQFSSRRIDCEQTVAVKTRPCEFGLVIVPARRLYGRE